MKGVSWLYRVIDTLQLQVLYNIVVYHCSGDVFNIFYAELALLELSVSEDALPVPPAVDKQPLLNLETLKLGPTVLPFGG